MRNSKFKKLINIFKSISFKEYVDYGSKISTIFLFFLALTGYIYTVKPKYFYDSLKIKSSKLENKNKELKNNIKKLKIIATKLEYKTNNLENNITKKIKENTSLLNKNKYISWKIFIKKIHIKTSIKTYTCNNENEHLICYTKQDKLVIKDNSPYLLLKSHFRNLKYSQTYSLVSQKDFSYFKTYLIENIEKAKNKLKFNSNINELIDLQNIYNEKIKILEAKIDPNNVNVFDIHEEIQNLHIKYDTEAKKRYKKVYKIINDFINDISKKYIDTLNLNIKRTIDRVDLDQRQHQYDGYNYTITF